MKPARTFVTVQPNSTLRMLGSSIQVQDHNSIILVIQSKCEKFSELKSACSKMLVHVKIFQFQDMLNESERYCDETNGL